MAEKLVTKDFTEQFKKLALLKADKSFTKEYEKIREQLVQDNIYLVDWCLQTYFSDTPIPQDEAKMYGLEGLVIAINNYDYQKGFSFASYAIRSIKHNIQRYFKEMIGISWNNYVKKSSSVDSFADDLPSSLVAEDTMYSYNPRYEMPITLEDYEAIDEVEDQTSIKVDENLADIADYHLLQKEIATAINTLPEREREVLNLRFGLKDGIAHSREETAKKLNISLEVVRDTEARAIRHLRHPLHTRKLKPFYEPTADVNRPSKTSIYIEVKNKVYIYLIQLLKSNLSYSAIISFIKMQFNIDWTMEDLTKAINLLNQLSTMIHERLNSGSSIKSIIVELNESSIFPVIFDNKYYSWNVGFSEEFITSIINNYEIIDLDKEELKKM